MPATSTVTTVRISGLDFAVQFSGSRYPARPAFQRGGSEPVRGIAVAVSRAALLDHLGNEVADMWRQLSADMRRAIRVAVHQQLRGA
jgi:hypothetical protein